MADMTITVADAGPTAATPVTAPADPDRKGPGRPRSARVDEAIITSVLELLAEGTPAEALSMEAVAARAGVGKATIYRRWPNKDALLVDAVAALKGPPPEIVGVSVRDDLVDLLRPVGRRPATPIVSVLPCLISELRRSPLLKQAYQRAIEPRRQRIRDVLRRGIASGELRPDFDIDMVMIVLTGPMVAQNMVGWDPRLDTETLPERVVDTVWPAIAAP
jgi:AcrR family transcriptional regulator